MKHRKYSIITVVILCMTILAGHLSFSSYAAASSPRRARLSGINAAVYDALAADISKVASGTLSSSKFSVTVSLKNALGSKWKNSYTAADLGVSALASGNKFTTATQNAVNNMFGINPEVIIEYLLSDMPYELYWFDKTAGWSGPAGIPASAYGGTTEALTLQENATFVFEFYVSAGYSTSGAIKTTSVNTTKTTAAKNAMNNANAIIEANKSKSDYEKLKAYKDKICDLVSYNTAAAGNFSSYGDAHQLIYVFDGVSSTNVVCEGYSKAFKYLCDNTTFSNSSISCHLVTGTMTGGTGAGAHMWNVVHMNDGKNYIVDVTNCDSGTIGAPNKLFLTGATKQSTTKYQAKNVAVTYDYYAETTKQFTAAELTIAGSDYTPPQSGSGGSNSGNSGSNNSGSGNSGSGSGNSGSGGSGSENSGSGSGNSGSGSGNSGSGSGNSGSGSGNSGSGGSNSGSSNSGNSGNNNNSGNTNTGSGNNNSGNTNTGSGNNSGSNSGSVSATKSVRVYFDANGGTTFFDYIDVVVGQKYDFLPYVYRTGYDFLGWSTSINSASEGAVTEDTICKLSYDHVLHAHWRQTSSGNSGNSSGNNGSSSSNSSGSSSSGNNSSGSSSDGAAGNTPQPNPNQGYSDNPEGSSAANRAARKQGGNKSSISLSAGGVSISISNGKVIVKATSDASISSATYTEYEDRKLTLDKPAKKSKSIYIPSKISTNGKTYKVTRIGNNAFRNNKKTTKITLPSTIKKVDSGAFSGASKLKTITIKGGSKKNFKKIVKMIKASSSNTRKCKFVHVK